MSLRRSIALYRNRAVWSDPTRKLRTLESFAETEEDGGKDLEVAARRVTDPDLRMHLERHADDERRHAELFRTRAAEVRSRAGLGARDADESDQSYDLSRGRKSEVDAHGFFHAGLCDEMGELAYVAMVHVAECRAAEIFDLYREANADDPAVASTFEEILKDEKYHMSYTKKFLDKWSAEGRDKEVKEALRSARSSRFLGAWKRLGIRSGAGFSQAVLFVLYWTVLAPFGLIARKSKERPAFRELDPAAIDPRSQY